MRLIYSFILYIALVAGYSAIEGILILNRVETSYPSGFSSQTVADFKAAKGCAK